MMNVQFERLFEVEIFHHYYASKISRDFDISPTKLCQSQLLDFGLIFKRTSKGFVVLYRTVGQNGGTLSPLIPIEENVKFSFLLKSKIPFLINYSDLPHDTQLNHIYYLHTLNDNQQNSDLLLTSDMTTPFISQNDLICLKSQFFQYSIESANSTVQMQILDELQNIVINQKVFVIDGIANYPVDLRFHQPGKFTLKVDGEKKMEFYASDELKGHEVFGIIDVFRNDIVPQAYQFIDSGHNVTQKTYTMRIEKRKTYWKYYIVLKYKYSSDSIPDLSITSSIPDFPIIFERQEGLHTLADGSSALSFISNSQISFQEEPIKGIQLKRTNGNGSEIPEIDNLPNASITSIKPNPLENRIYSEIFIYI